ncbi:MULTISPECIES: hypothetical protein [unclassified Spirosoma]|uniref:hypothetical protein n=1 Tax=unclassified Spirosoma TaxID=2621999 RepID=UPI000B09E2D8|nr:MULTISPECIES: hypothetical protein [unclassified Spirosoma]MBN8824648.1 hypothetical protein [Spirosoma sp.]
MTKLILALLLLGSFSQVFADIVNSEPTGYPVVDYTLVIGVVAVVVLLIVRRVRKRKQL